MNDEEDIVLYQACPVCPIREFSEVLCIRNYEGFRKNHIYAQVGWNNGSQVVRVGKYGDVEYLLCKNTDDDKLIPMCDGYYADTPIFEYIKK